MTHDRILASAPVNRQAAQQLGKGEHWTPTVEILDYFADMPPVKPADQSQRSPEWLDYSGRKFGQLLVIGLLAGKNPNRRSSWVCRCVCGGFCTRTTKSLRSAERGGNTFIDRCGLCDYQRKIREETLKGMRNG